VRLVAAAAASACLSLAVVLTARAGDPVLAVAGAAAVVAALALLASRRPAGDLAVVDPLWTLVLLLRGRVDAWSLLPLWAAQAVGALAAGLGAGALVEDLPVMTLVRESGGAALAVAAALAGLLAGWLVVAADTGTATPTATALPSVGAAVVVPVTATGAACLAPLFAGGVAGVTAWSDVFVPALALTAGAVAGALTSGPLWHLDEG
jgi:hypothetical protein